MGESFKHNANIQNFIDITFQKISHRYKPYRLLFIKSFNIEENKAILNAMLVIKYENEQIYFISSNTFYK